MSVAESTVIFGPMFHVGCESASAGVTPVRSTRPRNGPPEAVRTSDSIVSGARPSRHCCAAECSLSTGLMRPPPRSQAARARSPAATRLSLLASARSMPCSSVQSVAGQPGEADDGVQHDVGLGFLQELREVAADLRQRREAVLQWRREPEAAAQSSSSGCASITSSACRPIDPVAPSSATRLTRLSVVRGLLGSA